MRLAFLARYFTTTAKAFVKAASKDQGEQIVHSEWLTMTNARYQSIHSIQYLDAVGDCLGVDGMKGLAHKA